MSSPVYREIPFPKIIGAIASWNSSIKFSLKNSRAKFPPPINHISLPGFCFIFLMKVLISSSINEAYSSDPLTDLENT